MSTFRQVQKLAEFYDSKGQPEQPITVIGTRAHLRKEFKPSERGGGTQGRHSRTEDRSPRPEGRAAEHGLGGAMRWQPVTLREDPTAHIRTDGIEFCLTQSDQSRVALARAEAMAAVKKANQHDADIALKQWRGSMHRVGEALPQ